MSYTTHTEQTEPARDAGLSVRVATRLAWTLWAACVVLIGLDLMLDFITEDSYPFEPGERPDPGFAEVIAVLSLAYPTVGALIVSRLPGNPVGWIFSGIGLFHNAQQLMVAYAD